jgi:hypothetical protein
MNLCECRPAGDSRVGATGLEPATSGVTGDRQGGEEFDSRVRRVRDWLIRPCREEIRSRQGRLDREEFLKQRTVCGGCLSNVLTAISESARVWRDP